jgi:hypothetical protein
MPVNLLFTFFIHDRGLPQETPIMSTFPLVLLICLGMIGSAVIGSYAFDAGDRGPQLACANSGADGGLIGSCAAP